MIVLMPVPTFLASLMEGKFSSTLDMFFMLSNPSGITGQKMKAVSCSWALVGSASNLIAI